MLSVNRKPLISTLRARLTAWYLAILALTLSLFAFLLYLALARSLYRHHDSELTEQAESLTGALVERPLTEANVAETLAGSRAASRFVMIRNNHGELLYRSPVLELSEPNIGRHETLVHAAARGAQAPEFFTADLERSGPVRFVCVPLGHQSDAYLQLGNPLGDVPTTLRSVAVACFTLIPIVLLLTSFGGWFIAGRAMVPMRSIDLTLQAIQATDLSRRIEVQPADQELARLVTTVNRLLDRLDRAFRSLHQFAADVSHQLQTPLAVMRSALDMARSSGGQAHVDTNTLEDLADEVGDMSAIVADLRSLALADASLPTDRTRTVDFSKTVQEAAEIISALGESRDVSVSSHITPDVMLQGDAVRLKQIVLNLGDNAVKYTPADGNITIDLATTSSQVVLRVTDTGAGISQEHLPRIFDRFYRAESSRARADGTGLGLAIVKRIVEVHGGTVDVESRQGVGSAFTVRLPRM